MIQYIEAGTYLFRFLDHRTEYFWTTIADLLSNQEMFLNSRLNFNDPFDSQPVVVSDLKAPAIRSYFAHIIQNPFNSNRSAQSVEKLLQLQARGQVHLTKQNIENLKFKSRQNAFEYLDRCGLLSFSRTIKNPLLWGHYAASFSGICAVFKNSGSPKSIFSICADVLYVDQRPELPLSLIFDRGTSVMTGRSAIEADSLANKAFFLSFLHKDAHWSYEQEARIFFPFRSHQKMKFEEEELVGFVFGPNSTIELKTKLAAEIKLRRPKLPLFQATLSQTEFSIQIPQSISRRINLASKRSPNGAQRNPGPHDP